MNGYVHGGAAAPRKTKRVFLRTGTAREGYGLCYNWDNLTTTAEGDALVSNQTVLSGAMYNDARRTEVEYPNYDNNCHFAGVIDAASEGVVGPNWVTIHEPGSVCKVFTGSAVSVGITGDDGNQGSTRNFTIAGLSTAANGTATGEFNYTGLMGEGCACLLAEGAASTPNDAYLKMAQLQTGPPSGGVMTKSLTSLDATSSAMIRHGVIQLAQASLTIESTGGTISVTPGDFIGQELLVRGPLTAVSNIVTVSFLTAVTAITSLETKAGTGVGLATTASLSLTENFVHAVWRGGAWHFTGYSGTVA